MNLTAGIFLALFGAAGVWWTFVRFPQAHYTRASSLFIALSGVLFIVWTFTQVLALGLAAFVLLLMSCVCGIIGALRRETHVLPPG